MDSDLRSEAERVLAEVGLASDARSDLRAPLLALYDQGRAAWPQLECALRTFAQQIRASLTADPGVLAGLRGADLYLAGAAVDGDRAAQVQVDQLVRAQAQAAVARFGPDPAFAAEVAQAVLERLLLPRAEGTARLADYAGQGPLAAFLRVMALRAALNLRAGARGKTTVDDSALEALGVEESPEARHLRGQHQQSFREALRQAFTQLPQEQRQVVRLHYGGDLSGQEIAKLLGVDRSTVVRRLASARALLFSETRRQLQERLRLPQGELDSLIGALRSQLDLSLGGILKETQGDGG